MDYHKLGSRLRQERQRLNLTQEKLAEKVDMSHAYIGQIERGERSLTLETLVNIAEELDVTVDYLLESAIDISNAYYLQKIRLLLSSRTQGEQKMAYEMLELLFKHQDQLPE
ncbi:MAG TPA: helix-turn-helix domain-containing protein [Candidatus Paenibacillus intestinavium]|nr:helix-turn-helix domain-containing protein [Candidatus Paenibacillus intestinavium]